MKNIMIILAALIITSCSKSKLEMALELAGENRLELEKVLLHYSSVEDSLKLKAAKFLIENMPGHYSYAGDDINKYYKEIEPILKNKSISIPKYYQKLIEVAAKYPNIESNIVMDIDIITSDFLIYNIDKAFDDWEQPIAMHLNFDEFCESLLPYKVTELQSLDYWRDSLKNKFEYITPYPENIEYNSIPYIRYNDIIKNIRKNIRLQIDIKARKLYRPLSASNIYYIRSGTCSDYLDMISSVMRAHGIPIYKEFYPQWGKTNNTGHSYLTVVNKNGINLTYNNVGIMNFSGYLGQDVNIPKVYRETFAINPRRQKYFAEAHYISPNIGLFEKDITNNYYSTSTIQMDVNTSELSDKYVYLSLFSGGQWVVLDCAKQKSGKVEFEQVGRNNMYIIQGYNGKQLVAISKPFILQMNGDIKLIDADKDNTIEVKLTRKYFKANNIFDLEKRAQGFIEASNSPSFSTKDTICDITAPGKIICLELEKKYRYWRFIPRVADICNIAELQFYCKDSIVNGKIISNISKVANMQYPENAFDGDWLTNVESKGVNDAWIGLDFGTALSIDKILCVPRSDDNNIHIGDKYELKYWDNNNWRVLSIKIAEDTPLVFDQVPQNAVLLLENISRGNQTRIFTYEDNKQIWW